MYMCRELWYRVYRRVLKRILPCTGQCAFDHFVCKVTRISRKREETKGPKEKSSRGEKRGEGSPGGRQRRRRLSHLKTSVMEM